MRCERRFKRQGGQWGTGIYGNWHVCNDDTPKNLEGDDGKKAYPVRIEDGSIVWEYHRRPNYIFQRRFPDMDQLVQELKLAEYEQNKNGVSPDV